ncbi:MAG: hypothetical protein ACR2G4_05040 [Pyrinomonadaceae bacterium]
MPDSATLTVSVATSTLVVNNTVARVELTEDSNPSGIGYTVSGGSLDNGRTYETTLEGGGNSKTLTYTIKAAAANNNAGSVQFRVNLRAATNPPNTPPPPATLENPTTLTQGLLLTFKREEVAYNDPCFDPELIAFCEAYGGVWKRCGCYSPIVVDVEGNGFNLTNAQGGVAFDITSDGHKERIAWTAPASDDAWLALDRNANGTIELGAELFGNYTPQPLSENPHGFLALAEFDQQRDGGNGDGVIDSNDEVFERLRLWQDRNHNGISEADELKTLPELGLVSIDLDYKESRKTDEHGNQFRYRAKIRAARGTNITRWAWDVFLVSGQ